MSAVTSKPMMTAPRVMADRYGVTPAGWFDCTSRLPPRILDGPPQVVDPDFPRSDSVAEGLRLDHQAIYERCVRVFTPGRGPAAAETRFASAGAAGLS